MRFEAACCTKEIVSREDRNGNEAVEQQGEVIWSLVKDRLEMVMTEWFTLIKWDRDLSQRASTQRKVRRAEGVCVELASDGKGPEAGLWCCEALARKSTRCVWKVLGRLKTNVQEAPVTGGHRSLHTGKGQLEPGVLEARTTVLLLLWHSRGQGGPGDLLGFLWSYWKELGYSTIIDSHSHPPMLLIIWGIVWRTFPPPLLET